MAGLSEMSRPGVLSGIDETENSTAQWFSRSSENHKEIWITTLYVCTPYVWIIPQSDKRTIVMDRFTVRQWCGVVLSSVPALACCR